jgi:guanine nucleotide-binding protein G(i) subunit alpha
MKILYSKDSFDKDRKYRIDAVYSNVVNNMRALLDAYSVLKSEQKVPALKNADALKSFDEAFPEEAGMQHKITPDNAKIIMRLWNDPSIQKTYAQRALFQISDSTDYFFKPDTLKRIAAPGYLPDNMDVLRTRVRTSGIIEHSYIVENSEFLVIDVGGQRTERGKWIYVFADVDAIVYVASLSGYDQKLYEDETQNRMVEALQLFKEIVNLTLFPPECAMILFLNKVDLFEEKIKKVDPSTCHSYFQDYKGGCDADKAKEYFKKKFVDLSSSRKVYPFFTCAVDTGLMSKMMGATKAIVVNRELGNSVSKEDDYGDFE